MGEGRVVHLSSLHRALDTRIFHKECRALVAAGYDVHYVVHGPPARTRDGVTFHAIAEAAGSKWAQALHRLVHTYRLARALAPAAYHFHDPELVPVGLLLALQGYRVVYDVHEDAPQEALTQLKARPRDARILHYVYRAYEGLARRVLAGFVCATPAIAEGFPGNRRVLVRNYPRLDEFAASGPASEPGRLVYAGGLTPVRGIFEMLEVVARLPERLAPELVLLGQFYPARLEAEVADHPGWARTTFLGWGTREMVVRELGRAQVGLVLLHPAPEYLVSLPVKLFEYMAAGLPVVASDFPLWRSIVEEAGCGLLVDPRDVDAVTEAVRWLLEHPEAAAEMGARGRRAAFARYNWEHEAAALVDFYAQRVGPPPASGRTKA